MPLGELLGYLGSLGDAPAEWLPGELLTKHGTRYVRSQEGQVFTGDHWEPKYIWCRV